MRANQYCNKSSRIVGAINNCQILTHPPYLSLNFWGIFFLSGTIVVLDKETLCARAFWCIAVIHEFSLCYSSSITMINCSLYGSSEGEAPRSISTIHQHNNPACPSVSLFIKNSFLSSAYTIVDTTFTHLHAHDSIRELKVPLLTCKISKCCHGTISFPKCNIFLIR